MRSLELLLRIRPSQLAAIVKVLLGLRRIEVRTATNCRYWIDPVSVLGLELIRNGVYELPMVQLLENLLGANDGFIDLGANEGYFSCLAGKLCPQGRIYCVEPQRRLQPIIAKNAQLNGLRNLQVEHLAISLEEGCAQLYLRPSTNMGASSLFRHWRLGWKSEWVRTLSLDGFVALHDIRDVRLMKVDCEGAEELIFAGADETLSRRVIEHIALEYHPSIIGDAACKAIHQKIVRHHYVANMWRHIVLYSRRDARGGIPREASNEVPAFLR